MIRIAQSSVSSVELIEFATTVCLFQLGSHDQKRVSTKYGCRFVNVLNMLNLLLPGTAITYQGEEIGMDDIHPTYEETKDPQGKNAGPVRTSLSIHPNFKLPPPLNDNKDKVNNFNFRVFIRPCHVTAVAHRCNGAAPKMADLLPVERLGFRFIPTTSSTTSRCDLFV